MDTSIGSSGGRATMGSQRLSGGLGPGAIVFMVVAAAAPLTVVAGVVPAGITLGNGAAYPAAYVACTAVLLLFAAGFTAMSRHVKDAGAFYTYIAKGLGRKVGVGSAMLALVTYATVQLAVWGYIGFAIDDLLTSHSGPHLPWWVWSLVCMAVVGWLGYRNIDLSGKVLGVLLVSEVLIVLLVNAFIVGKGGGPEGISTAAFQPSQFFNGAPGIALTFAIAGYIGFEATAIFRDEARNPDRTIPRATYLALVVIGVFYAISSWALVSAFGDSAVVDQIGAGKGIVSVAKSFVGSGASDLVQVLLVTSLFAAALAFHNVLARYVHALGKSGVLPQRFGATHEYHVSPHVASVVQSLAALVWFAICVVAGLDPVAEIFTWFAGVAAVGVIVLMGLTSAAVIVFFRQRPGLTSRWHSLYAPALGGLGLIVFLAMTIQNLPLLVGGSTAIAWCVGIGLVLSFVVGFTLAQIRPHVANDILEETAA
ncbi:APC family permease [Nocardia sp. NPDC004860]|uniref:APC family permease n=1 Tax=Nocardia sp. NPDC004860 TaxID=3154557 RepID=UPI0033AE9877